MSAAVMAEDLFSGSENTIEVTLSAENAAKLENADNTDTLTASFTINGSSADGTIRRASRAEMQAPAPQGERPEGKNEPPADAERPEGKNEPPADGERPEGKNEPPADGERPEGKNEPPADGERPEGKNEPPADGERPEGMAEMISYIITIDGSDYLLMSMPQMPADGPEKPADVPEMPDRIGGTLSVNGVSKGSIGIMALAK